MLKFLYETIPGRLLLKLLTLPSLSNVIGRFLDSPASRFLIPFFVKKNQLDLSLCENTDFTCFNDCFCRTYKAELRPVDAREEALIAPCDGLLTAYKIRKNLVLPIKQSGYRVEDLLQDQDLAKKYQDGYILVFRLCVNHYHRYCFPDHGCREPEVKIPGVLHTVRPIALRNVPVFVENSREYTLLHTRNFGDLIQMEVGAMLVGKISNDPGTETFAKGQEKGHFLYGGSTIILLVEKDKVILPAKLLEKSRLGREIPVVMGQQIGCKADKSC